MVGKIKRARQKLHHGAVRVETQSGSSQKLEKAPVNAQLKEPNTIIKPATQPEPQPARPAEETPDLKAFNFPKGIFSGTKITPEALVQTLKVDEPSPVRTTKQATEEQKGREEKKQQSKKEKMKERRQRWLNKISAIKVAREQQVALERRKATPVVGDMRVLADALPELTQLLPSVRESATASAQRRHKGPVRKKAEPTDYYQMKPAQKRKLLETEASHFSEAMKDPTFKANPLAAIGEHLRKRLRQEDEQS
ncbi:protein FAM207A isoform X2 [Colossoma macropomum]|uniref:protein FAM207A isoform X2 n=1 Tax=Colossoma macropomum TaxID=42526 RepID=UPI0018652C2F|nr:protein FAM207A isoform X2 [Colossoma macropomum]